MDNKLFLQKLSEVAEWEYYSDVPTKHKRNKTLIRITKFKNVVPVCQACGVEVEGTPTIWYYRTKDGKWLERCANCKKYKDDNGDFTIVSKTDAY